ncbi:multicopper oxidase family protein [Reyranella sp.]|uniref:multicopper oxidase family protein n=1 Tax=Reyranella sp. TaxID=1929291 RepID=UPI00272F5507|nr:multicopper oxidase family protein [Reyranella sp.]MDP2378417.1 multicopper oxidase family protein [Reyranella sp.]
MTGIRGAGGRTGPKGVSRRRLLNGGTVLGAYFLLPGHAGAQHQGHDHSKMNLDPGPIVQAAAASMDQPLLEPEVRRSVNGVLNTTLSCRYAYKDIGGQRLYLRSYEGTSHGPTLRMKPGETLKIRLSNDFPPNRDPMPKNMALPHQFNNTNFHFHGAHCSPSGIADNVMRSMVPGKKYDIEITLPKDHTSGTYWYHPHHHGGADVQIASGMAGALIVEGDFAGVPEIANAKEHVMMMSQVVYDAFGMIEDFSTLFPETATRFLAINGQRRPTITMRPGEVQRWRLVGSQYQDDFFLELEKHNLNVIAYDGIQLRSMQELKTLLFAPGQRADILVQAGAPGTYEFRALPYDQGHPSPVGPLARLVVAGDPMPMKLPAALPKPPFEDIKDSELTGKRTVTFSATAPEADAAGHWQEFTFLVDGKAFDPGRIDQRVKLGAVEEWTILNTHFHDDHVFHIHTNPFQVTQVNGQRQPDLLWRDSVIVPRNGGSVVFRSRFLDYTGVFMLHCHMMNHEEMGMMQTVEVYKD